MQFLDPKIDIAFKKLFGSENHKQVTISFLNAILEYKGNRKIKNIQFLNTEQLPVSLDKKENILDIHCTDEANRTFIIEMQNAWERAFSKRIVYYGAKAYTNQLSTAKPYYELEPVTVVAITKKFNVFPDTPHYKCIYALCDTKQCEHTLTDLTFAFVELPKFTKQEHELVTDEDKWLFLLKEISIYDHIPEPLQRAEFKEACQLLNRLSWTDYEQAVYEKKMLDAQSAEGTSIALIERGKEQEKIETVGRMLKMGLDTDMIASATGLTTEEIKAYTNTLDKL